MKKKAVVLMAALALMCCSVTAFAAGTCQDWKGTWQFKYDNKTIDDKGLGAVYTKLCIITCTIGLGTGYEVGDFCNNGMLDPEHCQCFDNITNPTKKVFCFDNTTLFEYSPQEERDGVCPKVTECYNDAAPNCVCIANPLYRDPTTGKNGTAEVVIDNATDTATTVGSYKFNCIATGKRGTQAITIVQPDNATMTTLEAYYPRAFYTPDNGSYLYFEGAAKDIGTLPYAQIPEDNFTGTQFQGVYGYLAYDYYGLLSGEKIVGPVCVDKDGDTYGANCAAGPDCDDNDPKVHNTCDNTTVCALSVVPTTIYKWLLISYYVISATDSSVTFTTPITVKFEPAGAITDIVHIQISPRAILGFLFVNPFTATSNYTAKVTYGANACAGTFTVN